MAGWQPRRDKVEPIVSGTMTHDGGVRRSIPFETDRRGRGVGRVTLGDHFRGASGPSPSRRCRSRGPSWPPSFSLLRLGPFVETPNDARRQIATHLPRNPSGRSQRGFRPSFPGPERRRPSHQRRSTSPPRQPMFPLPPPGDGWNRDPGWASHSCPLKVCRPLAHGIGVDEIGRAHV